MKRIISVSIGSSKRNDSVEIEVLGEKYLVERIGTDGNIRDAVALIEALDGKVDGLGMGGIDLYIWAGGNRYTIREALSLKRAAKITPIVDGSGLKNTLERSIIQELHQKNIINFEEKVTLLTCTLDRFGMAEAIAACKGKVIIGDIIFALGLDLPIYSLKQMQAIAKFVAPIICQLPFEMIYPTGKKQNQSQINRFEKYYQEADIIAGDYHYIKQYMPKKIKGKIIISNTITKEDAVVLKDRGVSMLITSTPQFGDRSFGTNVIEALVVSIIKEGKYKSYEEVIEALEFKPRIEYLQPESTI